MAPKGNIYWGLPRICVKQVQCGKLALLQGNRVFWGAKMGHLGILAL